MRCLQDKFWKHQRITEDNRGVDLYIVLIWRNCLGYMLQRPWTCIASARLQDTRSQLATTIPILSPQCLVKETRFNIFNISLKLVAWWTPTYHLFSNYIMAKYGQIVLDHYYVFLCRLVHLTIFSSVIHCSRRLQASGNTEESRSWYHLEGAT